MTAVTHYRDIYGNLVTVDDNQYANLVTVPGNSVNYIFTEGENMAQLGHYGDILFNHEFSYEPYTVRSVKTGEVLGKVYEVNTNVINGLGSGNSLYSLLDKNDKVAYPLFTWADLLTKLRGY